MPISPDVRRLSLVASVALGSILAYRATRTGEPYRPPPGAKVPVSQRIDRRNGAAEAATEPKPSAGKRQGPERVEEIVCDVPEVDNVPEFHVALAEDVHRDASGGTIPPGKYRLTGAVTDDPEKVGGLWPLLFDFSSDGQGAFYRRLGLRTLSSRIRYETTEAKLTFELLCPDLDKAGMSFFYSLSPAGLRLMTQDGIVLSLERFADSEVEGLPPPRELPQDKIQLPPRR